ncbi:MAG: hypothetical protein WAM91_15270 [Candidatus Acidiferrales bacterium]
MSRTGNLPYQFLLKASVPTLQSFELSRLNHAANLKKQISELIDQYLDESTAALLARAMILRMTRARPHSVDRKRQLPAPHSAIASDRLLVSARSISSTRAIAAGRAIHAGRSASTEPSIASTRAIPSARAVLRSEFVSDVEIQHGMHFGFLARSHAR